MTVVLTEKNMIKKVPKGSPLGSFRGDNIKVVIEADNVSYKVVQGVKKQLEAGDCKILGAILNKVQSSGKGYYGYYKGYYGYYDSYGEYGENE